MELQTQLVTAPHTTTDHTPYPASPKKVTHPLTHLTQPHTTSRSWNSKQKGLLIIVMATFPPSSSCASTNDPIILTLFQPLIILLPRYLRCSFSLFLSLGCVPHHSFLSTSSARCESVWLCVCVHPPHPSVPPRSSGSKSSLQRCAQRAGE